MKIINLTQHTATKEQISQGVVDLPQEKQNELKSLLNCSWGDDLELKAQRIVALIDGLPQRNAMIGGAPYLMGYLERALANERKNPLYSFSERVSTEKVLEDGTIQKVSSFNHVGFYSDFQQDWVKEGL